MQDDLDRQKELVKQELYDKVPLDEIIGIYNEIGSMIKSLEDREKQLVESEESAK